MPVSTHFLCVLSVLCHRSKHFDRRVYASRATVGILYVFFGSRKIKGVREQSEGEKKYRAHIIRMINVSACDAERIP